MKTLVVLIGALLLAGCASSPQGPALTADQATTLAIQLANAKAEALYHVQPFHNGPPARFEHGLWFWTDFRGYGYGDIRAEVRLAADGSTISVEMQLLDSRNLMTFRPAP